MRVTERDRLMLQWINGHGFVIIQQAATWMRGGYEAARHRLGLLVRASYLRRKRFEHPEPLLHWLTRQCGEVAGETLSVPKAINRVIYLHDIMLVDLADNLVTRAGGEFVHERRLHAEIKAEGLRDLAHLPNGLLYLDNKKPIAIELELSLKAADRLRDIVTDYAVDNRFHEIWYVIGGDTGSRCRHRVKMSRDAKIRRHRSRPSPFVALDAHRGGRSFCSLPPWLGCGIGLQPVP